jgi:hypothetical protein
MNIKHCVILLFSVAILLGCGGDKKQVSGKVTFSDGKPVTTGKVVFATDTYQANGTINEDGSYRMGSIGEKDGVPPGVYKVFVIGVGRMEGMALLPLCDEKYLNAQTSGLTITIPAPNNKYDLVLEPHPRNYP